MVSLPSRTPRLLSLALSAISAACLAETLSTPALFVALLGSFVLVAITRFASRQSRDAKPASEMLTRVIASMFARAGVPSSSVRVLCVQHSSELRVAIYRRQGHFVVEITSPEADNLASAQSVSPLLLDASLLITAGHIARYVTKLGAFSVRYRLAVASSGAALVSSMLGATYPVLLATNLVLVVVLIALYKPIHNYVSSFVTKVSVDLLDEDRLALEVAAFASSHGSDNPDISRLSRDIAVAIGHRRARQKALQG